MREYTRESLQRVIRYGEAWALRHGFEWHLDARYPRLPFDGYQSDLARYEAWWVDSAVNCAYALLHGQDLRFALRCYMQVREYGGRLGCVVNAPDSHWGDLRTVLQNALEECLGVKDDYTRNRGEE